ncbi:MAG TPA: bacteriocin [Ohtaekwangia sp.]
MKKLSFKKMAKIQGGVKEPDCAGLLALFAKTNDMTVGKLFIKYC